MVMASRVPEMIKSKYNVKDRVFRFNIELANIGSMGSFLGQDATAGMSHH